MDAQSKPPGVEIRLCLGAGRDSALPICAPLPPSPCAFPDILPAVRAVADAMQEKARIDLAGLGRAVRRGSGCDACCRHLVVLGEAETMLREIVRLPAERRALVLARFRSTLDRLNASGLLPRPQAVNTREASDWRRKAEVQAACWEMALPCPLPEGGACAVYDARPLACRQLAVTSPPEACRTPFGPDAGLEKVLPAVTWPEPRRPSMAARPTAAGRCRWRCSSFALSPRRESPSRRMPPGPCSCVFSTSPPGTTPAAIARNRNKEAS